MKKLSASCVHSCDDIKTLQSRKKGWQLFHVSSSHAWQGEGDYTLLLYGCYFLPLDVCLACMCAMTSVAPE